MPQSTPLRLVLAVLALSPLCGATSRPVQRPQFWAVKDVRLEARDDAPRKTLLLRDGLVERVLDASEAAPAAARVLEGRGLLALPAFVDAYSFAGCAQPKVEAERDLPPRAGSDLFVDMRAANRKGVAPAFRAAEAFALDEDARKRWRSSGFSHLHSAPHGELLSGTSALACMRSLASRDAIVLAEAFDQGGFDCSGPGYPGTLMGAMAQLRQAFLDARWWSELDERARRGQPGAHPPFDPDLAALLPLLRRERRLLCAAESAADIERWIRLSDEFSLEIAIAGGREAWKRAAVLAERRIPVVLTLDWGDEPEDPHAKERKKSAKAEGKSGESAKPAEGAEPGAEPAPSEAAEAKAETSKPDPEAAWKYAVPLRAREDRRQRWEELRDGAQVLARAGIAFTFGTGKAAPAELIERARTLVEEGLPLETARAALTSSAARLFGLDPRIGSIQAGAGANLALWSADPLQNKDAKLGWLFVEGHAHEFDVEASELAGKPDAGIDASGDWTFTLDRPAAQPSDAHLEMKPDGTLSGTLRVRLPGSDSEQAVELAGNVAGKKLHLQGRLVLGNFDLALTLDGTLAGDALEGVTRWKGSEQEDSVGFRATRKPKQQGSASGAGVEVVR